MMPRRMRTRQQERHDRVTAERRINEQRLRRQRWLLEELESTDNRWPRTNRHRSKATSLTVVGGEPQAGV
jgi:hypothetical protein